MEIFLVTEKNREIENVEYTKNTAHGNDRTKAYGNDRTKAYGHD